MKKKFELFSTIFFSILIVSLTFLFLVSPKVRISEEENRTLQMLPKFSFKALFNGDYIPKLENYFNDQFAFRKNFILLRKDVLRTTFKDEINGVYFGKDDYLIERYNGLNNSDEIVSSLNNFYKKINYVNLNIILAPTSIEINKDLLPSLLKIDSQYEDIKKLYDNLNFNKIDITDTLKTSEYQVFYKTDHHWTSYGAYFAYVKYCEMNNIEPININNFKIKEVSNSFCGTLCSKTGYFNHTPDLIHTFTYKDYDLEVNYISQNKITKTLYEEKHLETKDKYSMFLDNNHPLIIISNSDIIDKREIVIIKDSYANAMIPFLVNHFKKVHVIDPRFYKSSISDYIKENKNIKDGLLIYNINTITEDSSILSID